MSSPIDSALEITRIYETCLRALNGAFHAYLDGSNAMTFKAIRKFGLDATEIANQSFTDTMSVLRATAEQVNREARLRAYTDAHRAAPRVIVTDEDLAEIEVMLRQEFVNAVTSGIQLAKQLMAKYGMLVSSGLSESSARIRVREGNRSTILQVYSLDKIGRKVRPNWAVYIKISAFLNYTSHTAYLRQAASLGFTQFELVQPGHVRDGLRFSLDTIPEKELHPQSRALIRLIKES